MTALKRLNPVMQEPEAVTILTEAELERLGARTIRGVSDVVPNFYMPEYGSRITSTIYVRGIGARMDNPSVGLNVDNVPYLNKDAYDFDVADMLWLKCCVARNPRSMAATLWPELSISPLFLQCAIKDGRCLASLLRALQ